MKPLMNKSKKPTAVVIEESGLIASTERKRPGLGLLLRFIHISVFIGLIIAGAGPVVWLIAASLNTSQSALRDPMGVFSSMDQWSNYARALDGVDAGRYLLNTVIAAAGATMMTVIVAISAGYVIAILRPRWAPILNAAILATIFLPSIVSLVPLYLTVVDMFGTGISLHNTFWAIWLPAGANAFSVLLMIAFMKSLPSDIIEAANLDGAGPIKIMWSIVMPLTRPILGVIALLAAIGSWKDYLWPSLVLSDPGMRTISVALPIIERTTELSTFFAVLVLASVVPIVLFLVFHKAVLSSVSMNTGMKD